MTAKIAYCAILRISFVIEYVYIFSFLWYRFYAYFIVVFLDRCPCLVGNHYITVDTEIKFLLFIIIKGTGI